MKHNKEWLIRNLSEIVSEDQFYDNNDFFFKLYMQLIDDQNKEVKEKRRNEL